MWDGHLRKSSAAEHRIILYPLDEGPIHTAPYRAELRQRVLEKEKVNQMASVVAAKPATTE